MSARLGRDVGTYADLLTGPRTEKTMSGRDVIIALALVPVGCAIWWNVEVALWGWFVVPLGLPPINWAWAAGLACLLGALRFRMDRIRDEDKKPLTLGMAFNAAVPTPLVLLLVGWLLHGWMP
jgi:hypothetical protein